MQIQMLFSNSMIFIGAGFMLTSIVLSLKMLSGLPDLFRKQWAILTAFMSFFLFGYLGFIFVQLAKIPLPSELITGAVFLGGAFFVFLVIRLTRQTIKDILNKEEQLKKVNQKLEQRVEERTRTLQQTMAEVDELSTELVQILNTISTGIRVIDQNYTIRRVNKSFCTMTGMTEEELVGSKCFNSFVDDGCREKSLCSIKHIDDGVKTAQEEVVKTNKFGQKLHLTIIAAPFTRNDGTAIGIVEDFQDISERVRIEQEREQMQTQLLQRSKLESVGQLAAGIAHEINTPVQYIGTNIDFFSESFEDIATMVATLQKLVSDQDKAVNRKQQIDIISAAIEKADWKYLSEEIPSALQQTGEGVNRVNSIVRAMKEFSHPGSKEKTAANLNDIIKNTLTVSCNEWKYVAEIKTELSTDLPMVPCLSEEMGQVFLNIIVNAAHAIGEQQKQTNTAEKGIIHIVTLSDDQFAEVRISDNGSGMNDEIKKRIFDPFFTTKEVGKGTGQGLSISHDVITRKHQGTLSVNSAVGKGTTFIIRLPLRDSPGQAT